MRPEWQTPFATMTAWGCGSRLNARDLIALARCKAPRLAGTTLSFQLTPSVVMMMVVVMTPAIVMMMVVMMRGELDAPLACGG